MPNPPTGRILRDTKDPTYIAEQERLRKEQFIGPVKPDDATLRRLERERWLCETPEGRAEWQSICETVQFMADDDRHTAELAKANRERRMLNGEPASIEPRSIHSKPYVPRHKRKLEP